MPYPSHYSPSNPPTPRIGPDPRNAETQEFDSADMARRIGMKPRTPRPAPVPGKPCPCCGQIVPQPSTSTENEPK